MTAAGRRLAIGLALGAGLLFAGRGAVVFLAERWWAAAASPAGAVFATRWALYRLALDAGAILLAITWFGGHLLGAAARVDRIIAAGAPRPAPSPVPAGTLRLWAIPAAVLLGVLVGSGTSEWAEPLALALERPRWGTVDQFHDRDAGFYIAILPLLVRVQFLALALALLGFIATLMMYAVGGVLRIASRRFVLDPGVRLHLAVLGASAGVVIGAGYLLEPWELASGLRPATGAAHVVLLSSMAWLLVGLAAAAAGLTLLWGVRGRIMLPVGAWASFGLFALVIRLLAPAAGSVGDSDREPAELREREREAFGLPELVELTHAQLPDPEAPGLVGGLWDPRAMAAPEGGRWVAAARTRQGGGRPAMLLVADSAGEGPVSVVILVDDEAAPDGHPLAYRSEGGAYPGVVPVARLAPASVRPGARGVHRVPAEEGGAEVAAGSLPRRLILTWALQSNLLAAAPPEGVAWRLDPVERLNALAPFADWGRARPVLLDSTLLWFSEGYLHSPAFPEVAPVPWRGQPASYLRAAFIGVVEAASGRVRVFERGLHDPLSLAWAAIARELVEPHAAMPPAWAAAMAYPAEWFAAHLAVLRRPHWQIGAPAPAPAAVGLDTLPAPVLRAVFQASEGRRVAAMLEGERVGGAERLRILKYDSLAPVESPVLLPARWERLPFVEQMRDSTLAQGWRYLAGPLQFMMTSAGPLSWQAGFAIDSAGQGSLVAVNLALGDRRFGTGPTVAAAWANLRGTLAAFPVSLGEERRLEQARLWLLRADSALRRGDLAGFGRSFEALRAILDRP